MTQFAPVLDHAVINVRGELDQARDQYRRLGFQLTERGHHSLGSSNHLVILGENYLELLGFEPGRGTERADLWKHPPGLTGLVFKTTDSLALHAKLVAQGIPVENPAEFSRPVSLPDGVQDARFRVVRLGAELIPNGRAFFCQHFTPNLVWRDAWRQHPNGAVDIVEFVIATADPETTAHLYRWIFGQDAVRETGGGLAMQAGKVTVLFLTPGEVARRFQDAAPVSSDGSDRMVALTLKTRSLQHAAASLASGGVSGVRVEPDRIVVPKDQAAGVALTFVA